MKDFNKYLTGGFIGLVVGGLVTGLLLYSQVVTTSVAGNPVGANDFTCGSDTDTKISYFPSSPKSGDTVTLNMTIPSWAVNNNWTVFNPGSSSAEKYTNQGNSWSYTLSGEGTYNFNFNITDDNNSKNVRNCSGSVIVTKG